MLGESQEAILTARHVQFCRTPCTPIAPIATLPIEPFVYLVSVLLDLGMSVSCSYHVITSSLLWVLVNMYSTMFTAFLLHLVARVRTVPFSQNYRTLISVFWLAHMICPYKPLNLSIQLVLRDSHGYNFFDIANCFLGYNSWRAFPETVQSSYIFWGTRSFVRTKLPSP